MTLVCVVQVLSVSSSLPPKVSAALAAAEEAACSLETLLQRERLVSNKLHQVDTHTHTCPVFPRGVTFNGAVPVSQHLQGAELWMDRLGQTFKQVEMIERHMKYLHCLQHIEELR